MLRILGVLVSGFLIGVVATWLYPASVHMGLGRTILLGVGGSLVADLAARRAGSNERAGCLAGIVGALALIFIGRHLW